VHNGRAATRLRTTRLQFRYDRTYNTYVTNILSAPYVLNSRSAADRVELVSRAVLVITDATNTGECRRAVRIRAGRRTGDSNVSVRVYAGPCLLTQRLSIPFYTVSTLLLRVRRPLFMQICRVTFGWYAPYRGIAATGGRAHPPPVRDLGNKPITARPAVHDET